MASGYIRVWKPGHPVSNKDGYALEHRYVVYESGVALERGMHVHHLNGDKSDNRLKNLIVIEAAEHARQHVREAGVIVNQFGTHRLKQKRPCERCGTLFMPWTKRGKFCSRACANVFPRGEKKTCIRGHKFTAGNTRIDREGFRQCRACDVIRRAGRA